MPKKKWEGRIFLGREDGKQRFEYVGQFATKRERDKAVAQRKLELERGGSTDLPTCDDYAERYLREYERRNKSSSLSAQTDRLKPFRRDFAGRSLDIPRAEAKDWLNGEGRWTKPQPAGNTAAIVSLYNFAIDEDDLPLERNPFRRLTHRSKGRSDTPPPSEQEFNALLRACSALGSYEPQMRAFLLFGAYSLMRPGEMYELRWGDIDFEAMRISKERRLYRGTVDEPKTGRKTIALTSVARDAIIGLPRLDELVFHSKTGKRLSQTTMSGYWGQVKARAGLDFDLYAATKHFGVHYLWTKLHLSPRAIAAQAGWKLETVNAMLAVYGHSEVGALAEVDAAFSGGVTELRAVGDENVRFGNR